jgi:hypothetical protein
MLQYLDELNNLPYDIIIDEVSKYEIFIQADETYKPAYMPHNLSIVKTYGNGLCWINAILVSIFGKYYDNITQLDQWIRSINMTFDLDNRFKPMFRFETYGGGLLCISNIGAEHCDVLAFLNANKLLMHVLSFNIFKFAVLNYKNQKLNRVLRRLPLHTGVAFDKTTQQIYAIDGQMRNFIMSIMGINRVVVYQHNINPKYRRFTNVDVNLNAIDFEGEYAGFDIRTFGNINCFGEIGSILLFTNDATHYDAILDTTTFKTTMALKEMNEKLPTFVTII